MCLIQIGSGSANFDTYVQDGFSNFIRKKKIEKKIFIIEANSIHLNNLKKFYEIDKNVKIFNLAIIPDNIDLKKMNFFYCLEDAPNHQFFSNSKSFVKKYFPNGVIKKTTVDCLRISEFFKKNNILNIDYLSIDIEGMDYEVLLNLDLDKFEIKNISFEHLHLGFWQKIKIIFKLTKYGYYFSGMGFDLRKLDWMFTKKYKSKKLKTYLLPITPRRIWKRYKFSDQI
jgi:FkbM family methyltransferase|tara:strand:+ start:117 stop:797 length:681 start_codon:yes stop_codon:yes gene_type:complete